MSSSDKTYLETLAKADNETFIIIDESHKLKTPFAKRSKRIKMCCEKTSYKLIMTGTPGESVKDLYMQYAMLSQLIIEEPNWLKFEEKYLIVDDRGDIIGYKNVDYLMGLLEPYTYQIKISEAVQLPAKRFETIHCTMTKDQFDFYYRTKDELLEKLDIYHDKDKEVPATLIFRYFTMLQQIASGFYRDPYNQEIIDLGNGKYKHLEDTGYEFGQTIFFCKYLREIDQIVKYLGWDKCAVFTGENSKERNAEKDLFTKGEKKYFVATMGTGGTSLNGLQHCSRMVFLSNSFKWIERKQCIGRIDRIGQEFKMDIYDMQADCGIEKRIESNLTRKGNLAHEIRQMLHDKTKLKKYIQEL